MEDSHEGIIDEETWLTVQLEMARRKTYRDEHQLKSYIIQSEDNPFTTKVFCGPVGQPLDGRIGQPAEGNVKYGSVTIVIGSKVRLVVRITILMKRC